MQDAAARVQFAQDAVASKDVHDGGGESAPWPDVPGWQAPISRQDFDLIREIARFHAGIVIAEFKRNMVFRRVSKRLRELGLKTVGEYCAILTGPDGEREIQPLINALTTNKTGFFREAHHFEHMVKVALPRQRARAKTAEQRRLRIWSAGCSSGEEPFSIAMTLADSMLDLSHWDARILATDIDTEILRKGSAGIYDIRDCKGIPAAMRSKYVRTMQADKTRCAMSEMLRSLVTFKPLNLLGPWPMKGSFDIVFCRNVVIYFSKDTQRELFDRFADLIRIGGFLYIGHSESLYRVSTRFKIAGQSIYQRVR
jgi:chemotaxis protein methyltransferase CheR